MRRILFFFIALAVTSVLATPGCGELPRDAGDAYAATSVRTLIDEADRRHDFGVVVGKAGARRTHRYRLTNRTGRVVTLLNVINHKTCCGQVQVGRRELAPGESTDVEVTLLLNDRFGEVAHETEVVTDSPDDSNIDLRTSASARLPLRIEALARPEDGDDVPITPRRSLRTTLRVYSTGTTDEPPADLDSVTLRSSVPCNWVGSKTESSSGEGLHVESRVFEAVLDTSGPAGDRSAEVLLENQGAVLMRHPLTWKVVPAITASPKLIAIKAGKEHYRVVLNARDQRAFRVLRVESDASCIQADVDDASTATTHVVQFDCESLPDRGRGIVSIVTDHASLSRIEIPYLVID